MRAPRIFIVVYLDLMVVKIKSPGVLVSSPGLGFVLARLFQASAAASRHDVVGTAIIALRITMFTPAAMNISLPVTWF